jgi:hypothetical protein
VGDLAPLLRVDRFTHSDLEAFIAGTVLSSNLRRECSASWNTDESVEAIETMQSGWRVVATIVADDSSYAATATAMAYDANDNILVAEWEHDRVSCRVLATTSGEAASLLASVRLLLPESKGSDEKSVRVSFWNWRDSGAERVVRRIKVPEWASVRSNYPARTRGHLDALVKRSPDLESGKLILWHGPPGTGKTWALRALLREWCPWVEAHYILDPEKFFGQSAHYMLSAILDQNGDIDDEDKDAAAAKKWRLLVIEDAAELLGKDARHEVGQGLARLLNVCDGLVGQGLRVLILLTTNEDVGTMHPAVIRRGRCIANIRFDLLSAEETREWAAAHGVTADGARSSLLAELYAADQIATPRTQVGAGFRPSGDTR